MKCPAVRFASVPVQRSNAIIFVGDCKLLKNGRILTAKRKLSSAVLDKASSKAIAAGPSLRKTHIVPKDRPRSVNAPVKNDSYPNRLRAFTITGSVARQISSIKKVVAIAAKWNQTAPPFQSVTTTAKGRLKLWMMHL